MIIEIPDWCVIFEANQEMQEPLEKLYNYENQPDMREKVKEYISELDVEIGQLPATDF